MLLIFFGAFLAQAQTTIATVAAPELVELVKRVEMLEQRVQQLEAKASNSSNNSGLKKVDYQNQTIEGNAPSSQTTPVNQEEIMKVQEQLKGFQEQSKEREKYLNELMDEN